MCWDSSGHICSFLHSASSQMQITQSFPHAFWRTKWVFIWNILQVAQCHAEVHPALKDKVLAGAVWKQTIAWQLFWEQAFPNKGSTKTWHSFLAGLCKPPTKPLVSAQTECLYYTLRALLLGNLDHSARSSKTILSTRMCKTLPPLWYLVTCPSRYVARMDLDELEEAKEIETLRTQGLPSDFYLQISRKHKSLLKKNKESRTPITTAHCKETNAPATTTSMDRIQISVTHRTLRTTLKDTSKSLSLH